MTLRDAMKEYQNKFGKFPYNILHQYKDDNTKDEELINKIKCAIATGIEIDSKEMAEVTQET